MNKLHNRLSEMDSLLKHPYLSKSFNKLKQPDLDFIREYVINTVDKTPDELMLMSVRIYLDKLEKPKHWKIISEFANCFASRVRVKEISLI